MKKVLIITYYWPPAGGIGVQRAIKFCKYLPEYGWEPVVLTVAVGNYAIKDSGNEQEVSHVSRVYRAASWEPHSLIPSGKNKPKQSKGHLPNTLHTKSKTQRLIGFVADFVRLNLFIPDARIGWYRNAVKAGLDCIHKEKPDLIFSTAPPYTTHLVAKKLKQISGLPWVADFRDPWLENLLYNKPYRLMHARYLNKLLERSVMNKADRVVVVGDYMQQLLGAKLPEKRRHLVQVITNGYDHIPSSHQQNYSEFFYISFYGTIVADQLPFALFDTLLGMMESSPEFKRRLRLRIFGTVHDKIQAILFKTFPAENISIQLPLPYQQYTKALCEPQVLLLLINSVAHKELIITGKVFDYLPTGNPIVGIGPSNGDAAKILRDSDTGVMFDYNDYDGLSEHILELYERWQQKNLLRPHTEFPQYKSKNLTLQLAKTFDDIFFNKPSE